MKQALMGLALSLALIAPSVPGNAGPIVLGGQVAQQRVTGMTNEIHWTTSMYQAQDQARREGKMVFWVHMLGDMKGAT